MVYLLNSPLLKTEENELVEMLTANQFRADQDTTGHQDPFAFLKEGQFRLMMICVLLCLFGWIPGVLFASFMVLYYILYNVLTLFNSCEDD